MILGKDALLEKIRAYIGEDTSDNAISLIEDVTDTVTDYDTRSGTDWEAKLKENDEMWRNRYMKRFSEPTNTPDSHATTGEQVVKDNENDVKTELEDVTFDDLFEKREG